MMAELVAERAQECPVGRDFLDSMDLAIVSRRPSGGRSSVLIRSLSRKPARFSFLDGASVSIRQGLTEWNKLVHWVPNPNVLLFFQTRFS